MKFSTKVVLMILGLGVIGLAAAWFALSKPPATRQNSGEIWTCPMHPQVMQDHPGQCPICGMNLVKQEKAEEHSDAGHSNFNLSLERQQMIGVRTTTVQKGPLFKDIKAAGRIAYDPELYTAQNEYLEAFSQKKRVQHSPLPEAIQSADRMLESARLRLRVLGLSDSQINHLSDVGKTDTSLLIGKNSNEAWVYADIYENDLPDIRAGLAAEVSSAFLQGEKIAGQVIAVNRILDSATRAATVRIRLDKNPSSLRPQSYVDVSIAVPLGEQITVPFDTILDTGDKSWVFVTDGQGHFEPRSVMVRTYANDHVAIASGLVGGEKIVSDANFLIDSESRLRAVSQQKSLPSCPKGQSWDTAMNMCM